MTLQEGSKKVHVIALTVTLLVLQRFPNKASLAMAVHKELGSSQGKKKMSRLKRIILRERADKAAVQAGTAAETAAANLVKSRSALECLQTQLQVPADLL